MEVDIRLVLLLILLCFMLSDSFLYGGSKQPSFPIVIFLQDVHPDLLV